MAEVDTSRHLEVPRGIKSDVLAFSVHVCCLFSLTLFTLSGIWEPYLSGKMIEEKEQAEREGVMAT